MKRREWYRSDEHDKEDRTRNLNNKWCQRLRETFALNTDTISKINDPKDMIRFASQRIKEGMVPVAAAIYESYMVTQVGVDPNGTIECSARNRVDNILDLSLQLAHQLWPDLVVKTYSNIELESKKRSLMANLLTHPHNLDTESVVDYVNFVLCPNLLNQGEIDGLDFSPILLQHPSRPTAGLSARSNGSSPD